MFAYLLVLTGLLVDDLAGWPSVKRVVVVEASREKNGIVQQQTRFYLSSLAADKGLFRHGDWHRWLIFLGLAVGAAI